MLIGLTKGEGPEALRFPRALPSKRYGFTFLEVLAGVLILSIILAAILSALSIGEFSRSIGSSKADLQAYARESVDVIARDVRQTIEYEIRNNNCNSTYMKFRKVTGWDSNTNSLTFDNNYIEYDYDSATKIMTRKVIAQNGSLIETREFHDLLQPPLYTTDVNGNIVDLNGGDLLNSRRLVIVISSQKQAKKAEGLLDIPFNLTQEVKIRNE